MPGYPNGTNDDSLLGNIAWYHSNSGSTTHAVGGKDPNAFGIYDMLGNVEEWCNDRYGPDYYSSSPSTDPIGPLTGSSRVVRGGHFINISHYCRTWTRQFHSLVFQNFYLGFRVAKTP